MRLLCPILCLLVLAACGRVRAPAVVKPPVVRPSYTPGPPVRPVHRLPTPEPR